VTEVRVSAARNNRLAIVPNLISALRLPIAAAFFAVDGLVWRGVLLFVGALTDALDGWLARRLEVESETGALLDPLFDKLFVTVALAAFLPGPYLGWREFVILISRDLYVGFAFLVAKVRRIDIPAQPRPAGKLVTFLQIVTLFVLLLVPERVGVFLVVVGVASVIAILDYSVAWWAAINRRARA
jgi:CDP-diacylglycerol--glycerol-3-phosphate 3-phosphatidyltransferase